jgi:hypothetical protein
MHGQLNLCSHGQNRIMPRNPRKSASAATAAKKGGASAKIEASAKAEVSAKAKWSRERVSIEFIPPDVTRANSRALLDIFSPIRHAAGLVGDRLEHRRDMLRLEREAERQQATDRIAARFHEIRDPSKPIEAPPNKFLYPFIAQASLEEPDSPLIDIWAKLLASAADHYDPRYIHYVSVMSRLSVHQAVIFTEIVSRAPNSHWLELAMDDSIYNAATAIRSYIADLFTGRMEWAGGGAEQTNEYLCECVQWALDSAVVSVVHAAAANETNDDYFDIDLSHLTIYRDDQEVDYAILVACGLLEKVETGMFTVADGRWSVTMTYYLLTALGQHFAIACRMVPPPDDNKLALS